MSAKENKAKDANEERITRLEAAQDVLSKQVSGMDGYFKSPEGLQKQIQDTMIATIPGIIEKQFQEYDKIAQARFATRAEIRQAPEPTTQGNTQQAHPFNLQGVIQSAVDAMQNVRGGSGAVDENYAEYLSLRNDLMKKALGGIGRGVGRGIEREITKHVVQFD